MSPIARKVLLSLKKIPSGRVTTYGILAKKFKTSPRAVGQIMKRNDDPVNCPCYKVIKSDGTLGGYSGKDVQKKIILLEKDGVKIKNGKIDKKLIWRYGLTSLAISFSVFFQSSSGVHFYSIGMSSIFQIWH